MYLLDLIEDQQKKLLNKFNENLKKLEGKNIDISKSIFAFGCTWQENGSFRYLHLLTKKNLKNYFLFFYYYLIDVFFVSTLKNFTTKLEKEGEYENLIISWGAPKNFDHQGNYKDDKFSESNSDKKNLWYILGYESLDSIELANNCVLHYNKKKFFNILFLIKSFFFILKREGYSILNLLNYFNFYSLFAEKLTNDVLYCLNKCKIKNILIPFEGQLFQEHLIKQAKEKHPNVVIKGYAHSSQPLPLHLIYKNSSIDFLIAHNHNQLFHLKERLNWPENKLLLEKSRKIKFLDKNKYINKIILPYGVSSLKKILISIKYLVDQSLIDIKNFEMKNHPLMEHSKKHQNLIKEFLKIKKNNQTENINTSSSTVIIGPTSSVPEALQNVENVFHIFENSTTQTYSNFFWPDIKSEYIYNNIIKYKAINKKNLYID